MIPQKDVLNVNYKYPLLPLEKYRPACFNFERGRAPRHLLLGKGLPMMKLWFSIRALQGHQGIDQGAWRQSPSLPLWRIKPESSNWHDTTSIIQSLMLYRYLNMDLPLWEIVYGIMILSNLISLVGHRLEWHFPWSWPTIKIHTT